MAHTSESLQAAFHYLYPGEVPELKRLAQSLPPNPTIVNIGAGAGTSGLAFMEARDDVQLITIDIQLSDSPLGCLFAEQRVLSDAFSHVQVGGEANAVDGRRYRQLCGDSAQVGMTWRHPNNPFPEEKVHMVFVDGGHKYVECAGDINAWLPNIKPGGIMAVHDYNKELIATMHPAEVSPHPKPWPGVDRAVRELLLPHYEVLAVVDSLISFRIR